MPERQPPETVRKIVDGEPPGNRSTKLLQVGYGLAEAGWTNHQIIEFLEKLGDQWGCLTPASKNRYFRYQKLLGLIKRIREKYPSPQTRRGRE